MSLQTIQFAVAIKTRTLATIEAIGLYDGAMCLITDRPDYRTYVTGAGAAYVSDPVVGETSTDITVSGLTPAIVGAGLDFDVAGAIPAGPPPNPVTGTPQKVWKEGMLAPDGFGEPGEMFDPTQGGGYSKVTGLNLALMNNQPGLGATLFQYLRNNGIDLFRCEVQFFVVIDGVFKQFSQTQIENIINGEHQLTLECRDMGLTLHGDVLKTEVTEDSFPDSPEDSKGKFLPLTIGRVPEAELLPVTGGVDRQMLVTAGGVDYELAKIVSRFSKTLFTILVGSKDYTTTEISALVGKYVRVARAGVTDTEYSPAMITAAAKTGGTPTARTVSITIDKPFRTKDGTEVFPVAATTFQDAWWVQVYALSAVGAVSDAAVSSLTGPLLGFIDPDFVEIEAKKIAEYPSGGGSLPDFATITTRPEGEFSPYQPQSGFLVAAKSMSRGLALRSDSTIPGESIIGEAFPFCTGTASMIGVTVTSPYPAAPSGLPVLYDRVGTSFYQKASKIDPVFAGVGPSYLFDGVIVDIPLPKDFAIESDEALSVGIKGEFQYSGAPTDVTKNFYVRLQSYLIDVYGQPCSAEALSTVASKQVAVSEATGTATVNIDTIGEFYYEGTGSGESATSLDKTEPPVFLGLIRDKERAKAATKLRVKVILSLHIAAAYAMPSDFEMRHKLNQLALFRTRDSYEGKKYHSVVGATFGSAWGSRKTATDPVLSIPDTIEYLIRERDGSSLIDTDSFDLANSIRPSGAWHIGKQIVEQESTEKIIEKLCKLGFLAIVPGRDNRRRPVALDGYSSAARVIDNDDFVLDKQGRTMVGEGRIEGLDRVYTGLEIPYDRNPATGDHRKTVFIRKTNESSFPAEGAMVSGTTVPLWTTYAGGFKGYNNAKTVWDRYHAAWLVTRKELIYKLDADWFQSNARVGVSGGGEDTAVYLALVLSAWYSQPRKVYRCRLPITSENLDLLLGDRVLFADTIRTGGLYYYALIEGIAMITKPGEEVMDFTLSHRLNDEGFVNPEDAEPQYITATIGGDTITSVIGVTDTITNIINEA